LGAGADPNAKDKAGNTPLHYAAAETSYASVKVMVKVVKALKALLEKGADIHPANSKGFLPIDFALTVENAAMVKCLLQHHYSNLCDGEGRLPLHAFLTDATNGGNLVPPLRAVIRQNVLGTNDLLEIIEFLVNQNRELVSARDRCGYVPLHVACATSAPLEIVRYLVEYAPETLRVARATDESSPLHVALQYGATSVVIDLLLHNQDPDTTGLTNNAGETPLHVACRCGASFDAVKSVMDRSGDAVKSPTPQGDLPLFPACAAAEPSLDTILMMKGHPDVVKMLISLCQEKGGTGRELAESVKRQLEEVERENPRTKRPRRPQAHKNGIPPIPLLSSVSVAGSTVEMPVVPQVLPASGDVRCDGQPRQPIARF
jgi:ankyrin repeat protein